MLNHQGPRKMVIVLVVAMVALLTNAAPSYRSSELKRLVKATKIDVSTLVEGRQTVMASGLELSVLLRDSVVCHVGRHLFPEDMRDVVNNVLLDFIERYFLSLRYPSSVRPAASMLREDGVKFLHGSLATVNTIKPSDEFSYTLVDKRYEARWKRSGKTILEISFPAEYQLIVGQNLIEAEEWVERDIKAVSTGGMRPPQPVEAILSPANERGYFIQKGNFYINKWINDNLYFHQKDNTFELVLETAYPIETCANMMLEPFMGDFTLNIVQHAYGGKKKTFDVQLLQWVAWCRDTGCKLYFGVEELKDGQMKATVFAVNQMFNFNHLLTFQVPLVMIGDTKGDIKADLSCFIPTHNIKDLYNNRVGNSGYKIYERAK